MGNCPKGCKEEFQRSNFLLTHKKPHLFVVCQWNTACRCSPLFYVIYRAIIALFFLLMIILTGAIDYNWYNDQEDRAKWFIYLTNWCFFALTADVIIQAATTIYGFIKFRRAGTYELAFKEMPWYLKAQWVVNNIATGGALDVSLAYFLFIYDPDVNTFWIDYITHAANMVYVIINIFITATPVRIYHFHHPVVYAVVYIIFSAIYQVAGGSNALDKPYIYTVLDWDEAGTAALYGFLLGIVAVIILWVVVFGLYHLRLAIDSCIKTKYGRVDDDTKIRPTTESEMAQIDRGRDNPGYTRP